MIKNLTTRIALEWPKTVYAVILLLVFMCVGMIPMLTIDTDPENMLAEGDPARIFHNQVKHDFAMRDMIVVGAVNTSESGIYNPQSLQALHHLSQAILQIEGVVAPDQLSLDTVDNITQAGEGTLRFEWLMRDAPQTQQQSLAIQQAVNRLPLLTDTLVAVDGKAAAVYVAVTSKDQSYRIAEEIRTLINSLDSTDDYYITGLPVAEDQFGVEMFIQMGIAAPMAGLAIFVLMWLFFRSVALVTGPMIAAMATVLITMGLLIGMGYTVHIMSSMIAIFLMPIAVVDSTHILSEFADRLRPGEDPKAVITEVISNLFSPMLYTSLTSAVGFLSLMLTPIPPVRVFGAFVAFGIVLAFALTIFFIPAYISRMRPASLAAMQKAVHNSSDGGWLGRWLPKFGALATSRPRRILMGFGALFVISLAGISQIQINDNPVNWFKADHEIRIADKILNQHFAGTYDAWLVLQSPDNSEASASYKQQLQRLIDKAAAGGVDLSDIDTNTAPAELTTTLDDRLFIASDEAAVWLEALLGLTEVAQEESRIFQSPEMLEWMAGLQQHLLESTLVGKVNALPDIVKTVNRELHNGNAEDFRIPATPAGVAQALLQYQSSHRPQDLWHFVTPDYRNSLMWLQLTSGDNQHMTRVVEQVETYIQDNPPPFNLQAEWAGKAYLNVVWQDAMVRGMLDSLLSSFAVVFLMMVLLFRSLRFGILAMLPLTFTITMIYGLIGWFGKDYDMPIAVLSALTLGLSIDFAIHFLKRFREIRATLGSEQAALKEMFDEPGRAIARNAIVIAIGFTPLLFAPLVPYITVGFFLASIMALSALVTLVLLPVLLHERVQAFKKTPVNHK